MNDNIKKDKTYSKTKLRSGKLIRLSKRCGSKKKLCRISRAITPEDILLSNKIFSDN